MVAFRTSAKVAVLATVISALNQQNHLQQQLIWDLKRLPHPIQSQSLSCDLIILLLTRLSLTLTVRNELNIVTLNHQAESNHTGIQIRPDTWPIKPVKCVSWFISVNCMIGLYFRYFLIFGLESDFYKFRGSWATLQKEVKSRFWFT